MSSTRASRVRLARVLRAVRLPVEAVAPVLLPSDSNDAWRIGPVVLRVCWRGDRGRFAREAAVTRALPSGVPYPEVLDTGSDGDLAWQVSRIVEGGTTWLPASANSPTPTHWPTRRSLRSPGWLRPTRWPARRRTCTVMHTLATRCGRTGG